MDQYNNYFPEVNITGPPPLICGTPIRRTLQLTFSSLFFVPLIFVQIVQNLRQIVPLMHKEIDGCIDIDRWIDCGTVIKCESDQNSVKCVIAVACFEPSTPDRDRHTISP